MKVLSYKKLKLLMSNITSKFATLKDLDSKLDKDATAYAASRLERPQSFLTMLDKSTTGVFDGTQYVQVGVSGCLDIANGGTGSYNTMGAKSNIGAMGSFLVQEEEPHPSIQNVGDLWLQEEK